MPTAESTAESTATVSTVSTAHAVNLARGDKRIFRPTDRQRSRHRMQRAARIYAGSMTLGDKVAAFPDKGWAALILVGCAFVFTAVGFAGALVVESVLR